MAVLSEKQQRSVRETQILNSISGTSSRKTSNEHQRKSTSRSSAGRPRSTRTYRDSIRSAVPETSIITMAKRPDQGGKGDRFSSRLKFWERIFS